MIREESNDVIVSARVPAKASKAQFALAHKTRFTGGAASAVAPVWRGLELIRDPYTGAASGQVSLTAFSLWNFALTRHEGWNILSFKLDA